MIDRPNIVEPSKLKPAFDCLKLHTGQGIYPRQLISELTSFDYQRVEQVSDPGDIALHGGVLDVFPATFESPLRIEFKDRGIVSIRSFNPQTFDTLSKYTMVVILPCKLNSRVSGIDMPFESVVDLKEGDYAVHLEHGIGLYRGKTTIAGNNGRQDALVLEYAEEDILYVPLDQLHLLQKYVSFGARRPRLHTLGGVAWENAKTKAYINAWVYAKGLLDLQEKRIALPGYVYAKDNPWQRDFEEAFPYRETPDQLKATEDIKHDMESKHCMDRLLLGDVGFGKTEVAIRAAFKAVMDNKQVAILVPTTILAYQHHRTLTSRMKQFPIQINMLSRFQSDKEQGEVVKNLSGGRCDIVVATHRLLSPDVRFHDLGLLIIDEEQRFGLNAKEALKRWRTQVDVLTLTATPIPRTLYLSLAGSRDMSLVSTPPENRHPVETSINDDNDESLRLWINKELKRGGQVYVVHNRVRSIQREANRIQGLLPKARLGVAHGRMAEDDLSSVMVAFIEGRLDILVTTTIIESGIDIPNANTLIVQQADTFGLADLYQLRGRVGRFNRRAHARLVVSKRKTLTSEASKRLDTLVEYSALGSGFHIAMEDLKLRGAGNLLGIEQSGHISAVGFDLYCRLLRDAIKHLKGNTFKSDMIKDKETGLVSS